MFSNRPEFHLADLAVMMLGAVPYSIYTTSAPEQIAYVVNDAGSKVALIEESFLDVFQAARTEVPALESLVVLEGERGEGTIAWDAVEGADPGFDIESAWRAVEPEDLLTLIYTSGTTGPPKGVELIHSNLLAAVESIEAMIQFPDGAKVISWLPSAHIAERAAHHYLPIVYAMTITCCDNPREVVSYLPLVKPTWFFAVPRIWEKLKAGLEAMLSGQPDEQREPAQAALDAAIRKVELEQAGEPVPEELAAAVAAADEKMFSGLRAMLGLDEVVSVNVGAAPTPREVLVFFHAIGIELAELWGMSETCGSGCCNPPGKVRIGTVGPPAPGVEITLADDGEVLMRSPVVMRGYRNQPEKTAEALDPEGWLHTGDIGEFDDHGYLRIVDRKKELIINAAGKNMSPANIEATMKGASPLIGQVAAIGDGRPYNTALMVLDADFAPAWAAKNGLEGASIEELAVDEGMRAAVQAGIDAGNARLARVEQVKKFTIISGDWAPGGEELTPTMKLKRRPIAEKYADEIEAMYRRAGEARRQDCSPALAAFAASAGPAAALPDEPDLVIRLPGGPDRRPGGAGFVDAFEEPGRLLYRFDAVIANQGGTLDLFRDPGYGGVRQAVWPGGVPSSAPKPDVIPSGATVADRSGFGAGFVYAYEKTHQHFHFSSAARYELQPAGGAARAAEKVGFCMFDSYEPGRRTTSRYGVQGPAGRRGAPSTRRARRRCGWGSRPGGADIYSAQRERQWVDITGLAPGPRLCGRRRTRCAASSRATRRTTRRATRGRSRACAWPRWPGAPARRRRSTLGLAGTVVAPDVPRAAAAAAPPARAAPATSGPRRRAAELQGGRGAGHGTVALAPGGGLQAAATYTPAAASRGRTASPTWRPTRAG